MQNLVHELNNLDCIENNLEFSSERSGYVTINSIAIKDQRMLEEDRSSHLSNGLPSMLMVHSDICEPYVTDDIES